MPVVVSSVEQTGSHKVRTASVSGDGTRTSFRFDVPTWTALDMVAAEEGISWIDWCVRAIESRPAASSKASAIRACLADALLAQHFKALAEEAGTGPRELQQDHPIVGTGYYCLDDETLAAELDSADITERNDGFEGFTLIVGYRAKSLGGNAFICIENRLKGGFHLFIAKD